MIKTFVVHLARAAKRRAQVDHILSATPDARVLAACDGSRLSQQELADIYPGKTLFRPRYPFPLSVGEVGCFESHKSAWRAIVEEDLNGALIIEDDVQIDPTEFVPALALAQENLDHWGYTQFQVRNVKGDVAEVAKRGRFRLLRPQLIPLRTSAQLVSRATASKLLALSGEIDRPVDAFLQMRWATKVEVTCVVPSGVSDRTVETGGSTLSNKRGLFDEVKASIPRLVYRRAIRKLSERT